MRRGTLGEVRDGSGDPRGGPARFVEPVGEVLDGSGCSGTVRGTLGEVRDDFGDPRLGPQRVGGISWRFGTGRGVPKRFGAPAERSGTGRRTLGEVWDGSRDPRGGSGRIEGPSERFGMDRGTRLEVRDGLGDPRG